VVQGFKLMLQNPYIDIDLDASLCRRAVRSTDDAYIRSALKEKIIRSDVVVCLIGNGTAWSDWVRWELEVALRNKIPICGIRLPNSKSRAPDLLRLVGAPIVKWEKDLFVSLIEQAVARGVEWHY
jgi:hypothetical protein